MFSLQKPLDLEVQMIGRCVASSLFGLLMLAFSIDTNAAIIVSIFPGSAYSANSEEMDAALGIQGSAIETFESTTLLPNLTITLTGTFATQTLSSLPNLFDTRNFPPLDGFTSFASNFWDGPFAFVNGGAGDNRVARPFALVTTFNVSGGASSFGIGLANFQSTSVADPIPITDHELLVNGVSLGRIESLAGPDWAAGVDVRNAYLRIDATGTDSIFNVSFRNITAEDALVFDHVAIQAVPEPSSALLMIAGITALLAPFVRWRRKYH